MTLILVFSTFVFWFARNYRAHRHLVVVNEHRRNALKTFEVFKNAATDDATKNTVLLEATRCIFAPATSGYLAGGDDDGNPTRIIEVLKTFGGSKPPN